MAIFYFVGRTFIYKHLSSVDSLCCWDQGGNQHTAILYFKKYSRYTHYPPPQPLNESYRILMFPWKVDFGFFFYEIRISLQILSGTLFSVQNNRWILIKRKIAEKIYPSDFTEIDLIVPPWASMFVQTGRYYR